MLGEHSDQVRSHKQISEHCNNMSVFTLINFEHFIEKFFKTPFPFDNFAAALHRQLMWSPFE